MGIFPALTLVIGGASSGKSGFAESLVIRAERPKTYIATAQAYDDEMQHKIDSHRAERAAFGWDTIEEHLHPETSIETLDPNGIALLDCATMWLNNLIMADLDLDHAFTQMHASLRNAPCPIVVVSNEVGLGIVPENALARRFLQMQGRLNAQLASHADLVVLVTAGLPLALKGQLPEAST